MKHLARSIVVVLPLLAVLLAGCTVVYEDDAHFRHPHYGYWR